MDFISCPFAFNWCRGFSFLFILYHNHLLHFIFLLPAFLLCFVIFVYFYFLSPMCGLVSPARNHPPPPGTNPTISSCVYAIQLTTTCTATAIRRIIHRHLHAILLLIRLGLLQGARRRWEFSGRWARTLCPVSRAWPVCQAWDLQLPTVRWPIRRTRRRKIG